MQTRRLGSWGIHWPAWWTAASGPGCLRAAMHATRPATPATCTQLLVGLHPRHIRACRPCMHATDEQMRTSLPCGACMFCKWLALRMQSWPMHEGNAA